MRTMLLLLAGTTITVTSSSVSPQFISPNGDGKKDQATYSFELSVPTTDLYPPSGDPTAPDGVYRWKLQGTLAIGSVRTITASSELEVPHPFVDDLVAARKDANDNAQITLKNGTELNVASDTSRTLPAGNYYLTKLDVEAKGTLAVSGKVVLWCAGNVKFAADAKVNAGGAADQLWIVQGRCSPAAHAGDNQVTLAGISSAAAVIYAPESFVHLAGKSKLAGAIVGRDVNLAGQSRMDYAAPSDQPFATSATVFGKRSVTVSGQAVLAGPVRCLGKIEGPVEGTKEEIASLPAALQIIWDGRNDAGAVVADGTYSATLSSSLLRERRPCGAAEFQSSVVSTSQTDAPAVTVDLTAPVIANLTPAPGSTPASLTPTISATYADALSGIDAATARLFLDGVLLATQATADGISFTPAQALSPGVHTVEVRVCDNAANEAVATWQFTFDSTPPVLLLSPGDGQPVDERKPTLVATYFDPMPGSGISTTTFKAWLDGVEVTAKFAVGAGQATWTTTESLADGPHLFSARIADMAGNVAEKTSVFRIVSAMATVGTGGGTLLVTDPANPIFGTSLAIPEGALAQSVTFSIEFIASPAAYPPGFVPAGPVVDFLPSASFSSPVTVAIPFGALPAGVPKTAVKLLRYDVALAYWVLVPIASIDTAKNIVYAQVTKLQGVQFGVAAQIADASRSVVTVSPATIPGDGVSVSTVVVTPKDVEGLLLGPNQLVTVTIPLPGVASPVQDLGNGTYQAFVTASSAGQALVTATVNGTALTMQPTIVFTAVWPDYFALEGVTSPLEAGTTSSVTLKAKLNSGEILASFAGTVEIDLTGTLPAFQTFFATFTTADQGALALPNALVFARAGVQQVRVTLVTKPDVIGFAQVVVTKGPAAILAKIAGDNQKGAVGTVLPQSLVTRVTDAWGNPIAGATVNYEATAGGAMFVTGTTAGTGPGVITKIAGGLGDGGLATQAPLASPSSAVTAPSGDIYIADAGRHVIRKVDTAGIISTVAGSGIAGYSGDGGLALAARLRSPGGLALDPSGNLYIADTGNHVVRKMTPGGIITTVAGTGQPGTSGASGIATQTPLGWPTTLAADSQGRIYIRHAAWLFSRLNLNGSLEYDPSGVSGFVDALWGIYYSMLGGDQGLEFLNTVTVTFAAKDDLYALYSYFFYGQMHWSLLRLSGTSWIEVSQGPIQEAGVLAYYGLAVRAEGSYAMAPAPIIFMGPSGDLLRVDGNVVRQSPFPAGSSGVGNVFVPWAFGGLGSGVIYIPGQILSGVAIAGNGTTSYGGDGGPATNAVISTGSDAAAGTDGNVYIADRGNYRIRRIAIDGTITTIAGTGSFGWGGDGLSAATAQIGNPQAIVVDGSGNIYFAEGGSAATRIRKISTSGILSTLPGSEVAGFTDADLTLDADGNLYVAETALHRIRKFTASTGSFSVVAGTGTAGFTGDGGPATAAQLRFPTGVVVDGSGNVWIADSGNQRLRRVSPQGVINTPVLATGIRAVAARPGGWILFNEDVYTGVGGETGSLIKRLDPDGAVTTIAGNGQADGAGDGGLPLDASLAGVGDLAVDSQGNLLVCETPAAISVTRIRKIAFGAAPTYTTSSAASAVTNANGFAVAPPVLLPDTAGVSTITATVTGLASVTFAVTAVDPSQAPATPAITSPPNNSTVLTATPAVSGTAPAGSTVKLLANGLLVGTAVATGGSWSLTTSPLASGAHTLVAYAVDANGVSSQGSSPIEIVVSLAPPTAPVITTPSKKTNKKNPTISGTATPFTTVLVFADGAQVGSGFSGAAGNWTAATSPLADGVYAVTTKTQSSPGVLSDPSDAVMIVIDTIPPDAPTNLVATAGANMVVVQWNPSAAPDTLGYNVWRKRESDPDSSYAKLNPTPVLGTEYTDTGVQNGIAYCYKVTAVDDAINEAGGGS